MDDTELMPAVETVARATAREPDARPARALNLRSALAAASAVFALSFVVWTQHEIATLHAEVREARGAAAAADRSAAQATLAARAAQSALASAQTQNEASDADGDRSAPDAEPTDSPDDDQQP